MKKQGITFDLLWSGQHADLVKMNFDEFGFQVDFKLGATDRKNSLGSNAGELIHEISKFLKSKSYSCCIVHGDTLTAMCGALAAFYSGLNVCHLEAGLRTEDIRSPFPEEANRKLISSICHTHYAPTELAKSNLRREGYSEKNIIVTGNTIVDSIRTAIENDLVVPSNTGRANFAGLSQLLLKNSLKTLVLVTCHRQENFGNGIKNLCYCLKDFSASHSELIFVFPVHPNPKIKLVAQNILGRVNNIHLIDPLGYFDFLTLLSQCRFCISDSGGIQEEARSLGVPLLLYRNITERPEILAWENCVLSKPDSNNLTIDLEKLLLLSRNRVSSLSIQSSVFGDGHASEIIVNDLKKFIN